MADSDRAYGTSEGPVSSESAPSSQSFWRWGPPIAVVIVPLILMASAALAIPDPTEDPRIKWSYPESANEGRKLGWQGVDGADKPTPRARDAEEARAHLPDARTDIPSRHGSLRRGFSPVRERPEPPPQVAVAPAQGPIAAQQVVQLNPSPPDIATEAKSSPARGHESSPTTSPSSEGESSRPSEASASTVETNEDTRGEGNPQPTLTE